MRAVDAANNIYARPIAFNGGVNLLEKVALETIYQVWQFAGTVDTVARLCSEFCFLTFTTSRRV